MTAFLLLIWVGGHSGYLTVPGIASEQACHALAKSIASDPQGLSRFARASEHSCIAYQLARY